MFYKPNSYPGVPIYVQLKEQIRHAVETGVLFRGDQLPRLRALAETLVINPSAWILSAFLLGLGGMRREGATGTALFTLALPVKRMSLVQVRAALLLGESVGLALIPVILIPGTLRSRR